MIGKRFLYPVLVVLVLTATCSNPPENISENLPVSVPLTLVVERTISGMVLGQPLRQPVGLAIDYYGKIYVCDAGNNRLLRFDDSLKPERETGGLGSLEGLFKQPSYIALDNGLNIFISDNDNRRICRHNKDLHFVDAISLIDYDDPLKYGEPSGLALTDYGEIWMCDKERGRIAVFDNVGQFNRFIGDFGYAGGQLLHPGKIIQDEDNFIVCDGDNRRLVVYDRYGNFIREIGKDYFDYPISVLVDKNKNLWVLDGMSGSIFFINKRGEVLFESSPTLPGAEGKLNNPADMVMLRDGRLLISDSGNNRLLLCRVLFENQ